MAMRFEKAHTDASEQIALEIRRYLERSGLQPGERLGTEADLAAEFGVSRPTLREALRLLASSHLVRATQGRNGGIFVANTPNQGMGRSVSASVATMIAAESVDLVDLMQARMFMESPLAALAAEHRTPETVTELERAIAAAQAADPGTPEFNAADFAFHRAIAEAAGNDLMVAFTGWTLDVLQPHLADEIAPRAEKTLILEQHGAILRAIRRGQAAAAEQAMRAHIAYLREVVAKL
jgi:DNA-binding FadR family transcriptional regulator